MAEAFARQDLLWLDPEAPGSILQCEGEFRPLVKQWLSDGHPAVVTRQTGTAGATGRAGEGGEVTLGIPLPSRLRRLRLGFRAATDAVRRKGRMPLLGDALSAAPEPWRVLLRETDRRFDLSGVEARVYGSLGWQHLTGETYLHPRSDIDLLLSTRDGFRADGAVEFLREIGASETPRFDGEWALAPGLAIAWRELLAPRRDILVRGLHDLRLESAQTVWNALGGASRP